MERLCKDVADAVERAVEPLAGDRSSSEIVGPGADGTPTKAIDEAADNAALEVLESHGDVRVVSEESGETVYGDPEATVVVDPLDGTYNAAHGIPVYAFSIGVADGDHVDDVEYAYVRELRSGSTYTARRDEGAWFDGEAIQVEASQRAGDMAVSGVYNVEGFDPAEFQRVRLLGCSSLEMCYVAAGRLDGFLDLRAHLRVVDFAAAALVIKEAGGVVTNGAGEEIDRRIEVTERSSVVAGAPRSHDAIMEVVT
ncbi:MAG: bifunctional fructose-bisphosphatase/inositol-phosphate phosphatase [Halobacteriales archaeon]